MKKWYEEVPRICVSSRPLKNGEGASFASWGGGNVEGHFREKVEVLAQFSIFNTASVAR